MSCIQTNTIYSLINVKGETCMDLSGGDNRSIIGYGYHNGPNQAWIFESTGRGTYVIKSVGGDKYLAPDGDLCDGRKVIASPSPYEWCVVDEPGVPNGVRLKPAANDHFCADLSNFGSSEPGTPIELWGQWEGQNQVWRLHKP